MKRLGYKDVLISVDELVKLSNSKISTKSVLASCMRANITESTVSWLNEPDPFDGRKIMIRYSSVPKQTVAKYNLPDVNILIDRIKYDAAIEKDDLQQQQLEFKIYKLQSALEKAATTEYIKFCPKYDKLFPGQRDKVVLMAKTHSVLECCIDLRTGFTIYEIHSGYLKITGIKHSLKNVVKFGANLKKWNKEGINIVHKRTGPPCKHLIKLTIWHIGKVEQYYAHANKYTTRQIHELLTADCQKENKQLVSIDTVSKYVAKPEVKNRLSVFRDKAYFNRVVQPHTRRLAPTYSGDLYYADGSPLQIPCWNKQQTKIIRLNLFAVMDVKSKKIVGFDLSESEDRYNWFAAFKMAFSTEMLLPYEMMYDNASATKTTEFIELKKALQLKGCNLNPTTKGEPKQKADIERWFETLQSGFQRMVDGFIGEGIRSKRDNGRIDIEHLTNIQKTKGYFSYEEMLKITATLIQIYNNKSDGNNNIPALVFASGDRPNAAPVNYQDIAYLFWTCKKIKVTNSEVKITIRHNEYYYNIYDHTQGLKLNGTQVKVYYDETDLSTVHLFSLSDEPLFECRQKVQFHKAKANQTEADVLQIIKQSKHNSSMATTAKQISRDIAARAMQGNPEFLQMANPYLVSKESLNQAETKAMLTYISENKGVNLHDKNDFAPDTPATVNPQKKKQSIQERHSKQNIQPATYDIKKTVSV